MIFNFLWDALRFIGLLHLKNPAEAVAAAATIHCQIVKFVNGATSSSNTSTPPIALQDNNEPEWVLDSGASYCVTGNRSALRGLHVADTVTATVANGQHMRSTMCGRTVGPRVNLSGVRYFDGASANLISAGVLVRQGCEIRQNMQGVEIWKGDARIGCGRLLPNNLWSVDSLDDSYLEEPECTKCPNQHSMLID